MYELFIGNYERVMGQRVFHKVRNRFIPCLVTNYYFKPRKYTLVPIEDLNIPSENRRLFYTQKVYLRIK